MAHLAADERRAPDPLSGADEPRSIEELGGHVGWHRAADGTRLRFARFPAATARQAGAALLLQGFTEFIEKHLETVAELQARGWAVWSFDWRGQGLSDRPFADRHLGHIEDFDHFLADLGELIDGEIARDGTWRAASRRLLIGNSMGGHMALRMLAERDDGIERAVLTAPMVDILTGRYPRIVARALARLACRYGLGGRFIPGAGPYGPHKRRFERNRLTHCERRFARIHAAIDANPDLALGGPTFRWVASALDSIERTMAPGYLARVRVPVLIVSAGLDVIVRNAAQHRAARLLPDCRLVTIAGAKHEILSERDETRALFWEAVDRFLAEGEAT